MGRGLPPTVVVRYDDGGQVEFYAEGDVRLFVVDERAPTDRVYEIMDRFARDQIREILGDDLIGHRFDGSAAARKLGQSGTN